MIAATRGGLRGPRLLLSVAVLVLAIALVFRSLTPAVPQMADDLPTSIYDITVKVVVACRSARRYSPFSLSPLCYLLSSLLFERFGLFSLP